MYAEVINGAVTRVMAPLYGAFKFHDGRTTGNVELLNNAELKQFDIFPLVENKPGFNPAYQYLTHDGYTVGEDSVTREWAIAEYGVEVLKAKRTAEVNTQRDALIDGGITYEGVEYDSNLISRTNLSAVITSLSIGQELPEGFAWRSADNTDVPMDADTVKAFADAMLGHVYSIHLQARIHKDAINALSTPQEVAGYQVTFS